MTTFSDSLKSKLSLHNQKRARAIRDIYREIFDPYPYRAYMRRHKCIFIHIPKTAGTSVLAALGHRGVRDHATYREFQAASPSRYDRYYKFGFVRDPYSRIFSLFGYLKKGGNGGPADVRFGEIINKENMDFYAFCKYIKCQRLSTIHPLFWPQVCYVVDGGGNMVLDFLGKMENIDNDFQVVKNALGLRAELPELNKTKEDRDGNNSISESSALLIQEMYDVDFSYFNYERL